MLFTVDPFDPHVVGATYSKVARDYADAFADDLDGLPVDRAALDDFQVGIRNDGLVLDLGCGPGQVGRYLAERGIQVIGVDLADQMVQLALNKCSLISARGDMRLLPFLSGAFAGTVAFYSIQHVRRDGFSEVLDEVKRVLSTNGLLLIATHLGAGVVLVDELLGHKLDTVGGTLYGADELHGLVEQHGFEIESVRFRDSLPHEHRSQRIYLRARSI